MLLNALSIGEKFSTGSITFFMGILITFALLALLIVCIILMEILLKKLMKMGKKAKDPVIGVTEIPSTAAVASTEEVITDTKTLEAVNAAVKTFMTNNYEAPHEHYTVRTVKKVSKEA